MVVFIDAGISLTYFAPRKFNCIYPEIIIYIELFIMETLLSASLHYRLPDRI